VKAAQWLRATGLFDGPVSDAEAAELRKFREALRALIVLRAGGLSAALLVTVDASGQSALEPANEGLDGVKARLLAIVHEAQVTGDWSRMKGCRQCEYAFYDRSKNRSATWCAMSICGNRTKNRAYYARRRST
jgi:predicted RNA-binding Zn ribbon-like protein